MEKKLMVRDLVEVESVPAADENEGIGAAIHRLRYDLEKVASCEDMDTLVTELGNLKEVIDLVDVLTGRQVSVRQLNLRKKYGSYSEMKIAVE